MLSVAPTRRLSTLLACVALGVLAPSLAAPVDPARALAAPGDRCAQPGDTGSDIPWPHTMLALDSVWPFTRGGGTTVAVLSTGVDADQPRLRGHVLDGFDAMAGAGPADSDCTGTGTQVAGVIAAQAPIGNGGGVTAVAPATRILPVRVIADDPAGTAPAAPAALARGITWSAEHDADVIVVATPVYRGTDDLRDAVAGALTRGTVVVAAVGDLDGDGPATPYPAGYPGVLGVGAVGPDGLVWAKSRAGDFVDLVAPGVAVSTVQRGSGLVRVDGTAVAAGFVGGVAALVRAKRGNVLGSEITRIIVATASPAPRGESYGAGVVNPYPALTEAIMASSARALPEVAVAPEPMSGSERRRRGLALAGAGLAGILVVAVLLAAVAVRRRTWRPGLPAALPVFEEPVEPGPPVMLLDGLPETHPS